MKANLLIRIKQLIILKYTFLFNFVETIRNTGIIAYNTTLTLVNAPLLAFMLYQYNKCS
jgi:hypothetical protein